MSGISFALDLLRHARQHFFRIFGLVASLKLGWRLLFTGRAVIDFDLPTLFGFLLTLFVFTLFDMIWEAGKD